jgi:hypothetical protein
MSAVFCDGFDTYSAPLERWLLEAASSAADTGISTVQSRNGGQALRFHGTTWCLIYRTFVSVAHATIFVHAAMRRVTVAGGGTAVIMLMQLNSNNGAVAQTGLAFQENGSIIVKRGLAVTGTQIGTASLTSPLGTWFHLGWKCVLGASGSTTVWLNGATILNLTGVNTQNNVSYATYDSVTVGGNGGSGAAPQYFDDLVVLNGAGSINNNFLGDVAVVTLRPDGAGDRTQLAPVGGTTNWDNVNDPIHTGTDYNASNTDGQGDLYTTENLPASVGVSFVQQTSFARKNTTAAKSLAHIMKIGGTEYAQTAIPLDTSFAALSNVIEQNPAGGAWDSTALNAAQIGVEVRA